METNTGIRVPCYSGYNYWFVVGNIMKIEIANNFKIFYIYENGRIELFDLNEDIFIHLNVCTETLKKLDKNILYKKCKLILEIEE
jgi:hypothetical protein